MKGLRGTKITLIWYVYVKENISLSLLTTKYIASNCCTFSDIDFWFDQHCKAPEATAYTQRNLCIPNLLHLAWRSFSCFLFHQRSKSTFLKMLESLVLCINRLYQMYFSYKFFKTYIPKVISWYWQVSQLLGQMDLTLDSYLQRALMLFRVVHISLSSQGLHFLHDTGQSSWIFFAALHFFSSGFISSQNFLFEQFLDATTCLPVLPSLNGDLRRDFRAIS